MTESEVENAEVVRKVHIVKQRSAANSGDSEKSMVDVRFRTPRISDAEAVHRLVVNTEALDSNSWYYYALFFRDFAGTSLVAEVDGQVAGFVTAYLRPEKPDTLFLWQTATTLTHGVPQLGLTLLTELLRTVRDRHPVRYVEATIDPANRAIAMQFRLLARQLGAPSSQEILLSADTFAALEHDEQLVSVGPLS